MARRLLSLVLIPVVLLGGLVPAGAGVSPNTSAHACCRTLQASAHEGCPRPVAAKMRCCAPEPDRDTGTQTPPASAAPLQQPDFTLLKGRAAHVPELPALIGASVAHAFAFARLKLPHDPLYLRNVVLLV
jgi:hypothetical protein